MRIKELREINNISQKELAAELKIPPSTLSQYENGKREPNFDFVKKIAEYFNVSTDYIYGLSTITTCSGCGLSYCPDNKLDIETHREIHTRWLRAKKKYGFCYSNYGERELIKSKNRNIVKDFSLSLTARYNAQIEVFKCLFSRSLEASNYDDRHVDFKNYISMLLHQPKTQERLGKELTDKMISEFGTKEGLPNGQTYYYSYESTVSNTLDSYFDNEEYDHIKKYRALDTIGQKHVDFILNWETDRMQQLKDKDSIISELKESKSTVIEFQPHLEVNAAHARTDIEPTPEGQAHDDAIMNDDSEWE